MANTAVSIERQIQCVERELGFRRRVYARRVEQQQMTQRQADEEVEAMQAVLVTLQGIKAHQQPALGL